MKGSRFALTVVAFTLLGPPLDALLLFLPAFILDLPRNTSNDLQGLLLVTISPVTYFYGGPPAACTGAVIAALAPRNLLLERSRIVRLAAGTLVGGAFGAAWQLLAPDLADPFQLLKAGAFAGGGVAIFFPRTRWITGVPSNNRSRGP